MFFSSNSSETIQSLLLCQKISFLRIICSHEHFLFFNLPFDNVVLAPHFVTSSSSKCIIFFIKYCFKNGKVFEFSVLTLLFLDNLIENLRSCADYNISKNLELTNDYKETHFLFGIIFSDLVSLFDSIRSNFVSSIKCCKM